MSLQWDHVDINGYEQIMTEDMMKKEMYKRTARITADTTDNDRI